MFIIQQFKSNKTPKDDLKRNNESFNKFLTYISKSHSKNLSMEKDSGIWGPFKIPGSEIVPVTIMYIGKLQNRVELA